MNTPIYLQLAISLLLGLLVGLQRERAEASLAGIRTFALIAMFGTLCGWLGEIHGGWVVVAGLLAVAALFVTGYFARAQHEDTEPGLTTEVAGLLMFVIGAYLVPGSLETAVVCGGALAVLLQWKKPLHGFAARVGNKDIKAITQFVLITLVILPVLPNRTYGPFHVLNPFNIWLMAVLIVGISLAGYVASKVLGDRAGTILAGLLGGLVSSTATTVSFSRRARNDPTNTPAAALVIMMASTVVYIRVLIEAMAVAPQVFTELSPPLFAMLGVAALITALSSWVGRHTKTTLEEQENPSELRPALIFALVYAIVLVAVAYAKQHLGSQGLYAVAFVSGLAEMDAITLSTAQLAGEGALNVGTAWRLILVASLANLLFKAGIVALLGERRLLGAVSLRFALALLGGVAILLLWP